LQAGTYTLTITTPPGLQNDFTTPTGTLADITLGSDQTIGHLNFGFLIPGQHHHGDHDRGHDHDNGDNNDQ
jgi:hypothetical protein